MAATFAGADTVGTAVTSENAPATIAPITIERIASSLRHSPADLSGSTGINKPASGSCADAGCSCGRARSGLAVASRPSNGLRQVCTEILPRETARRDGAGGPIIFTDGFDECRNGGGECAARNGGERDLPNHLGLRDESMSNAWVNR